MRSTLKAFVGVAGGVALLVAASSLPDALASAPPAAASYVGSERCRSCHGNQFGTIADTGHANILRAPTKRVLRAPAGKQIRTTADGEVRFKLVFQHKVLTCTLYSLDGSQSATYRICYVMGGAGSAGEQLFLTRVNAAGVNPTAEEEYTHLILPVQYNHNDQTRSGADAFSSYYPEHWYDDDGTLIGAAGASPAVLGSQFANSWERRCAGCHTTGTALRYNKRTGMMIDRSAELNVGCEACHGPGSIHEVTVNPADIVNPWDLPAQRAVDVCRRCHVRGTGRRSGRYGTIAYPGKAKKTRVVIMPFGQEIGRWFSHDPVVWDSDDSAWGQYATATNFSMRNHQQGNDYTQSAHWTNPYIQMFCWDCHTVHTAGTGAQLWQSVDDNSLCLRCHANHGFADDQEIRYHTRHSPGASRCTYCHMPATARAQAWWGTNEGDIHSHTFEAVNPNLTWAMSRANVGPSGGTPSDGGAIPNGCFTSTCHSGDSDYGRARWSRWIADGGGQVAH